MAEVDEVTPQTISFATLHYYPNMISQITDDEKLQIAQHFLLSSPPGQFTEILTG